MHRVFLIDDHPLFRSGLRELLERRQGLEICGEADNCAAALDGVRRETPDLVVVDLRLQGTDGLELVARVHAADPKLPILVLSMQDEALYAERALHAGARGYVMKSEDPRDVVDAVEVVLGGRVYLSPEMTRRLVERASSGAEHGRSAIDRLTDRELQVLRLIGEGRSTSDIAADLALSVKTIETYRAHLKEKLGLRGSSELMRFAVLWVQELPPDSPLA
ncbi:MAG: response regulator transcription factor [Myxococcales bacterium]|nr:response regulator transcription factor [Myxococcales bacterium]